MLRNSLSVTAGEPQSTGDWPQFHRDAERSANQPTASLKPPPALPYQFHVRVEAIDKAGNIGESITPDLVKVDLSNPKVNILRVEPAEQQPSSALR